MEVKTMPSPLNVVGVNFMDNESLAHRYQDFLSKVWTAKFYKNLYLYFHFVSCDNVMKFILIYTAFRSV
jgi:hypothetical protein